jgi:glyoxylase-like metal-dependent hydrolase (beta-lactamase superfamily II)
VLLGAGEKESLATIHRNHGQTVPRALAAALRLNGAAELVDRLAREDVFEPLDAAEYASPDEWITNGTPTGYGGRTLVPIATPGHTGGHLVFHDPAARLMFAGDHVLPHITPSVGFEAAPPRSPLGDYIGSLHAMLALPDARLLPAHGPVRESTHARVRDLVAHHDRRLDETERAVRSGVETGYEVARRLTWTSRGRAFEDLDLFNRSLAVNETVAHLVVLADQGRIRAGEADGVVRYAVG